jgi:tryptophanyl-tRNA synthetase
VTQSAGRPKRIMSGMRPTGRLHIGHYWGALENWLRFQDEYDSYFSIVDWHALTTKYNNVAEIKRDIIEIALDWLAVGIDPEQSTIYVQSAIPEIAELHLLLSMVTPQNWVEREPTLKDMVKMLGSTEQEGWEKVTYGFLGYPVLMTADILTFKAELVPVGKDQESHLEFSRDVVRRFNHIYGVDYFGEPKPKFTETPLIRGLDGQKMGKSFNNDIKIADTPEDVLKKVKSAITDRTRLAKADPGHLDLCEVPWPLYKIFTSDEVQKDVQDWCENAKLGCVDCKTRLAGHINEWLAPKREKRMALERDIDRVHQIIEYGNSKARKVARQTLSEVREIMGLNQWDLSAIS